MQFQRLWPLSLNLFPIKKNSQTLERPLRIWEEKKRQWPPQKPREQCLGLFSRASEMLKYHVIPQFSELTYNSKMKCKQVGYPREKGQSHWLRLFLFTCQCYAMGKGADMRHNALDESAGCGEVRQSLQFFPQQFIQPISYLQAKHPPSVFSSSAFSSLSHSL